MAEEYTVDGTEASMGPINVSWQPNVVAQDHNGNNIYSGKWDVVLTFPAASPPFARQWQSIQDSASHTIDCLGPDSINFFTLSPVYVIPEQRSGIEDINSTGFSIRIKNATKPDIT